MILQFLAFKYLQQNWMPSFTLSHSPAVMKYDSKSSQTGFTPTLSVNTKNASLMSHIHLFRLHINRHWQWCFSIVCCSWNLHQNNSFYFYTSLFFSLFRYFSISLSFLLFLSFFLFELFNDCLVPQLLPSQSMFKSSEKKN